MTFEGVGANPLATPVHAKTYANPVINFSLPDPTIIKETMNITIYTQLKVLKMCLFIGQETW